MAFPPELVTRNWKLKLAALGLALLLWTSLRIEALDRQTLPGVPVRVQLNDPQWAQTGEPQPATVTVHFSGPARELLSLYLERPTVTVPVDEVTAPDSSVLLRFEWVRLPNRPGVTVEEIEPRMVRLAFEPITQGVVPIAVRVQGELPQGLALVDPITVNPDFARVIGPRGQIEEADSLYLEPLDLSEIEAAGTFRMPVDTSGLTGVVISPGNAEVTVPLEERVVRRVEGVPVTTPASVSELRPDPLRVPVIVSGARSRVEELDFTILRAEVPAEAVEGLEAGEERSVPLEVLGVPRLLEARPAVDSVTVRRPPPEGM